MEDQYKVKLLKGVDLALHVVESEMAECAVESSFYSFENENETKDNKEDIMSEVKK